MATPRGLLAPGESVVLDLRAHGRALLRPAVLLPVIIGVASFAIAGMPKWAVAGVHLQGWSRLAVLVVALLAAARWCLLPFLRWRTRRYVVTTDRIVLREGMARRRSRDVPLNRITDISVDSGLVERLFRSGTLIVDSGGESGRIALYDVPRVGSVQRTVNDLVRRSTRPDPRGVPTA